MANIADAAIIEADDTLVTSAFLTLHVSSYVSFEPDKSSLALFANVNITEANDTVSASNVGSLSATLAETADVLVSAGLGGGTSGHAAAALVEANDTLLSRDPINNANVVLLEADDAFVHPLHEDNDAIVSTAFVPISLTGLVVSRADATLATSTFGWPPAVATSEIARMLADARAELPGAIMSAVQAAYFATLRDFLDFTNAWQEDVDIVLVPGITSYAMTPPSIGRHNRLLLLWDSQDSRPNPGWVCNASMRIPGFLTIAVVPSKVETWVATIAKTIKDPLDAGDNPLVDAWIIHKYWDTLLAGILSRMMLSPSKTYTDKQLGMFYGRKFLSGKTVARNEAIKGNVRGQTNWAYPRPYHSSQRGF